MTRITVWSLAFALLVPHGPFGRTDVVVAAERDAEPLSSPPAAKREWLDVPKTYDAPGFGEEQGVRALFFEGAPFQGKSTRVFAWLGLPEGAGAEKKAPAMVLVHGGGGTAFAEWVRLWTSRGYAAIAMDTCGCVPEGTYGNWKRHEHGGPPGWGGFEQVDETAEDQWPFHAVASVVLAHSLIRSMPEVDPERVGITGISWGGYLTCIAAGVDDRFKLAVPVYGCGFLGENSCWLGEFERMGPEKSAKWLGAWDPSHYLPAAKMPMLWVTGTNDFAYPLDSLRKSYRLPEGPRTLCIRVRMPHAHGGPGENPEEIRAMADALLRDEPERGPALAKVTNGGVGGGVVWTTFECPVPVVKAELVFTKDSGRWQDRNWETLEARLEATGDSAGKASAEVPEGATVFYLNLIDERGLVVSTDHVERDDDEPAAKCR